MRRFDDVEDRAKHFSSKDALTQSTWVYLATTLISEHIMRTDVSAFKKGSPDERIESHEINQFLSKPNDYVDQNTGSKVRYAYMMELLLNGSVTVVFPEMAGFKPLSMCVIPRWKFMVRAEYDNVGRMVPVEWKMRSSAARMAFIQNDNLFYDPLYNPFHDFEGLAPLVAASVSVMNDSDVNEFTHRFFENDGSTGIVFTTENPSFRQQQAVDAAKAWKEIHSGLRNAHSAKFVGFGLTPHKIGTPLDAKMLQIVRTFTKEEIVTGIYKIPLAVITAQDSGGDIVIGGPAGGAQASANESFLINVVMPWAKRYDENFNRHVTWRFDPSIEVRHDFTGNPILDRRRLERARAMVELIDRGVPLNEVIRWLKLDIKQQAHGNDWWIKNTQLPARVVLAAGQDAIKIAIPDNGKKPVDPNANQKSQILNTYVDEIVRLAQTVKVRNSVERNGHADDSAVRIAQLMGLRFGQPAGSDGE